MQRTMLDAELEQTADEYGMRWIAESREGDRGASDWRSYGSEIEAQLAAMHELMGAHHRTLGLGRRLAIRLGPTRARTAAMDVTPDGAVLHVEIGRRDGSDLARAWWQGLRSVLRRTGTRREIELLDAFEEALLAERPRGATRSERMRGEWFERTFEAFIETEGWSRAGGDVTATTREVAKREATGPKAAKYPSAGPARTRWPWLPASGSVRERTNWLWHMLRAAIEWDIDGPELRGTPEMFAQAHRLRREHQERWERAAIEFARLSSRSIANARAAGHAHAPVIGTDEDGPCASIIALEGRWHEPWTREDDGRPPNINTPWLAAQLLEALTEHARDCIGFDMIGAIATMDLDGEGAWSCTTVGWDPQGGVDGSGDPTYGDLALVGVEHWGPGPMLTVVRADTMLATLGEAMARTLTDQHGQTAETIQIYWDIVNNTFISNAHSGRATSISEMLSGTRTERVRRRAHNAKNAWERRKTSGADAG